METSDKDEKKLSSANDGLADLYLEGSDQFRGWFNSSLITATILTKKAPYRQVLAHGFVVDEQGRKMSKSLGNVIDPEEVRKKFGTDVLRLWVITMDFTKEIKVSEAILERVRENYQKIRNTCRFLLGNLQYLEKEDDLEKELRIVDYWILAKLNQIIKYSEEKYQQYEFNAVYTSLLNFCNEDLSSFYFEVCKDSLYCDSQSSKRRKQIITTLYYLLSGLLKIIIPVLPFLAEEIYQHISFKFGYRQWESVFLVPPSEFKLPSFQANTKIFAEFFLMRQDVFRILEKARQTKLINTSFQAIVWLYPKKEEVIDFSALNLAELLCVAQVKISKDKEEEKMPSTWEENHNYFVKVEKIVTERCFRCWNYENLQDGFCPRCREIIS